jgi:hypothetical protein
MEDALDDKGAGVFSEADAVVAAAETQLFRALEFLDIALVGLG